MRHLDAHDPERTSLKSAARAALVMPSVFAFTDNVIANPQTTIFSAFGSFSTLVLADFEGSPRRRLTAYVALAGTGVVLIAFGTMCSQSPGAATAVTAIVGFVVLFSGLINRYFAAGAFAALLSFILSVNVAAPASAIPARLEGWGIASAVAIMAVMLLWPARPRPGLRLAVASAFAALADVLQSELDGERSLDGRLADADAAVAALRARFVATPYRPTGTTSSAEALAFLVDETDWLCLIVARTAIPGHDICPGENCETIAAAIAVMRASAARLEGHDERPDLDRLVRAREAGIEALLRNIRHMPADRDAGMIASALEPSFRAHQLSYAALELGANAMLATGAAPPAVADVLPPRPSGAAALLQILAAQARSRSVWFQNSVRGAAGLAIAAYVAQRASLQHAFWVVLGTLSVLRSNALGTGATIVQAVAGTAVGIVVGGLLIVAIGADHALLWAVLPLAVLIAAYAPRAISFAAGQAGFTVVLLILFNIIQPSGWRVGLVRVEDVAIGFGISLGVGLLLWPRGARAALRTSVADAYATGVEYLAAVATSHDDGSSGPAARSAAGRLDDAYRQFLAERGHERLDGNSVATLVNGARRMRIAGYSLLAISRETGSWERSDALDRDAAALRGWYLELAEAIRLGVPSPAPQPADHDAYDESVRRLDAAVAGGDRDRIRMALGATLATEHIGSVREFEARLAAALDELDRNEAGAARVSLRRVPA